MMKFYRVPQTDLEVSGIAYGCDFLVRQGVEPDAVSADDVAVASRLINVAYDNGITLFDTASAYQGGSSEVVLGRALAGSPGFRSRVVIQTKCSSGHSRASIIASVEGSLRRLETDYLDLLLLHFHDPLMEPHEVADAFDELHGSGKVRHFGVSNHTPARIDLLKKFLHRPLVANQIHLGLVNSDLLDEVYFESDGRFHSSGTHNGIAGLDYSRLHEMQVEAYSPLRGKSVVGGAALLGPPSEAPPELRNAAELLQSLAAEKQTTPAALALAWLIRHPGRIIPIIGSKKAERIVESCTADGIELSPEEWYALWAAGRG
jgi:predicted oxidoreductase